MRFAILLVVLVLAGCATADVIGSKVVDKMLTEEPATVEAKLVASPEVNPDAGGRPSPIVVTLFELTSLSNFNGADFFALSDNAVEVLADELQGKEELHMLPGSEAELLMEFKPGSRYLAVVAAYRRIDEAQWRAVLEVPPDETIELEIRLEPLAVHLEVDEGWF